MKLTGISGRSKAKVLLVEDDPELAITTTIALKAEGWRANYVYNGREALTWIEENGHPDVILLDLNMPIMTGAEFMKEYSGPAAIIVTTAWHSELPYNPFEIVPKPYSVYDLSQYIDEALAANGGPKWARLLPCEHSCVGVSVKAGMLTLECFIPGCNKCRTVNANNLDFETLAELTLAIAQDQQAREETSTLS